MIEEDDPPPEAESEAQPNDRDPERWYGEPGVCGSCIAWRPATEAADAVATGGCRLRPELGRVPASLKKCDLYKPRGQFVYQPDRAPDRKRRRAAAPRVLRRSAEGDIVEASPPPKASRPTASRPTATAPIAMPGYVPHGPPRARPPDPSPPPRTIELGEGESVPLIRQALVELLRDELGRSRRELAPKFKSGATAAAYVKEGDRFVEIPADRFFGIVDRTRSSLDALENAVAAKKDVVDEIEQWLDLVRRMKGSFTTFNILFAHREDYFTGKE